MNFGDLREALHTGDGRESARLLLESRGADYHNDWLTYARGVDPDVISPERLVEWATVTDAKGRTDRYDGVLTVAGVGIEVPGLEAITRRWVTRPGWYVLDLWELDAWVRTHGAEHRDAPRRCLKTVDAYHYGGATASEVREARGAAFAATRAAPLGIDAAAAAAAAYAAANAACAARAATSAYAAAARAARAASAYAEETAR